ncbi:MAG: SRPBCC family protein [Chloroflexi bacterium]|nr:SRPBCC family protein [Chloroflexota bacterium]
MARIDKDITVSAPLEQVFAYIKEPGNWPEFWPNVMEVEDIKTLPNGGYSAKYQYKMAGMRFSGTGEHTEFVPNQWIVIETGGGVKSAITLTFRSIEARETRLTLTIEYKIPVPLLGKLAEAVILKMNEQEAELMMSNIRARFLGSQ